MAIGLEEASAIVLGNPFGGPSWGDGTSGLSRGEAAAVTGTYPLVAGQTIAINPATDASSAQPLTVSAGTLTVAINPATDAASARPLNIQIEINPATDTAAAQLLAVLADLVHVDPTAHIDPSGEPTDAVLTPPAGKLFATGRMWDDENGVDQINVAESRYTELVWAFAGSDPQAVGKTVEFRVVRNDGTALDGYDSTPTITFAVSTDQFVAINPATDTSSARPLTPLGGPTTIAISPATDTAAAQPVGISQDDNVTIVAATTTDIANPLGVSLSPFSAELTAVTTTDIANVLIVDLFLTIVSPIFERLSGEDQAHPRLDGGDETYASLGDADRLDVSLDDNDTLAETLDSADLITVELGQDDIAHADLVDIVTEPVITIPEVTTTDIANPLIVDTGKTISPATDTDSARPLTPSFGTTVIAINPATDVSSAQPVTPVQSGGAARVYWKTLEPAYSVPSPTGSGITRTVTANSTASFQSALNAALPGDVISVPNGTYGRVSMNGRSGTLADRIKIVAQTKHGAVITGGPGYGIAVANADYWDLIGFKIGPLGSFWAGILVGGYKSGAPEGPCNHFRIRHCWSTGSQQEGMVLQGGRVGAAVNGTPSDDALVEWCDIDNTGNSGAMFGEGIYLGFGNEVGTHTAYITNVEIRFCDISGNNGEGIDIKTRCTGVHIHDCDIHDITAPDGGAGIVVLANVVDFGDGDVLIERNRIWNITRAQTSSVAGIEADHGLTTIRNNLIWNIQDQGIRSQERDGSAVWEAGFGSAVNRTVHMENNTIWGCTPDIAMGLNDEGAIQGIYTFRDNLTEDGSHSQATATAADFDGTVFTGDADDGTGVPGAAFNLAATSSHRDAGTPGTGYTDDLYGDPRPAGAGWSRGAIEQ